MTNKDTQTEAEDTSATCETQTSSASTRSVGTQVGEPQDLTAQDGFVSYSEDENPETP